jgi:hypothetical protein
MSDRSTQNPVGVAIRYESLDPEDILAVEDPELRQLLSEIKDLMDRASAYKRKEQSVEDFTRCVIKGDDLLQVEDPARLSGCIVHLRNVLDVAVAADDAGLDAESALLQVFDPISTPKWRNRDLPRSPHRVRVALSRADKDGRSALDLIGERRLARAAVAAQRAIEQVSPNYRIPT